ncbi:hypothetical protein CDAR_197901 [Caerostris darwini]|uniref:Uncharacterized protein n=1 Tax=Caerostris darwini TaxID=1538125 RepID=A0AAV4SF99_9ARAC|nr:hypothetical protein CDAR_197901 [Caerostris darwini]
MLWKIWVWAKTKGFDLRKSAFSFEQMGSSFATNQNLTVIPNCYRYQDLFSALVKVPLTLCCKAFKGNILSGAFNGGNAVSAHF